MVTYDEHGGFYDHAPPPDNAVPPGDVTTVPHQPVFNFKQYGVRVPTIVISPYTARNLIDSTPYDHTSFLRTLELLFDLPSLTARDANAADFVHLLRSVQEPRLLASPADHGPREAKGIKGSASTAGPEDFVPAKLTVKEREREGSQGEGGRATGDSESQPLKRHHYNWLHVVFLRDLAMRQYDQAGTVPLDQLRRDVIHIRTVGQARSYMTHVREKVRGFKSRVGLQ